MSAAGQKQAGRLPSAARVASIPSEARAERDAEIARRWLAGESQARLGRDFGLSDSGVHRVLARVGKAWCAARAAALREAASMRGALDQTQRPGRKAVWPDCPPELRSSYRKIRSVIGSEAAKAQLLALSHHPSSPSSSSNEPKGARANEQVS
jgi:hypothetical protein